MNKRKRSGLLIGIFIIVGVAIGVFALGWLGGAQRYFRSYKLYTAVFAESVRGVYPATSVAFQGVDVGSVQSVGIAPDPAYVEVVLRIYRPELIRANTVAQIAQTGIAGSAYIELSPLPGPENTPAPSFDFPISTPVIPTEVSTLNAVLSSARAVAGELQASDVGAQARASLVAARELLSSLQTQLDASDVPQTIALTRRTVEDLDTQVRVVSDRAGTAIDNLQQATDALNKLLQRLALQPSALLSSQAPPRR